MKIYISGKITGDSNYKQKFKNAELFLRLAGFEVVNPADQKITGKPWAWYMRKDIAQLMECEAIFLLKDWKKSKGARLEYYIAKKVRLGIYKVEDLAKILVAREKARNEDRE